MTALGEVACRAHCVNRSGASRQGVLVLQAHCLLPVQGSSACRAEPHLNDAAWSISTGRRLPSNRLSPLVPTAQCGPSRKWPTDVGKAGERGGWGERRWQKFSRFRQRVVLAATAPAAAATAAASACHLSWPTNPPWQRWELCSRR